MISHQPRPQYSRINFCKYLIWRKVPYDLCKNKINCMMLKNFITLVPLDGRKKKLFCLVLLFFFFFFVTWTALYQTLSTLIAQHTQAACITFVPNKQICRNGIRVIVELCYMQTKLRSRLSFFKNLNQLLILLISRTLDTILEL